MERKRKSGQDENVSLFQDRIFSNKLHDKYHTPATTVSRSIREDVIVENEKDSTLLLLHHVHVANVRLWA